MQAKQSNKGEEGSSKSGSDSRKGNGQEKNDV